MIERFKAWRRGKVRLIQWGDAPHYPYYIRFTPNFGFSIPWFGGRRLRFAWHHGLQTVKWVAYRWYVERQVLGRSRVRGERYLEGGVK